MMRITLLRHGKPDFELKGIVRARELSAVANSYDLSGIADVPPGTAVEATRESRLVVCSHLPRSLESAKALGFLEAHVTDPLYCETAMPHFQHGSILLPVGLWAVMLRIMWLFGFSRNGESLADARKRARRAAARLMELAAEHRHVLLVGHGFMNSFIAKELLRGGWCGPSRPGKGYWEYGVYEKAAAE